MEQNILQSGRDFCVEERQSVTVRIPNGDKQEIAFQPAERLLCVRIKKVLPAYLEASRRTYGREGLAKITLEHYLKSSLAYLGAVDSWRFADTVTSGLVLRFITESADGSYRSLRESIRRFPDGFGINTAANRPPPGLAERIRLRQNAGVYRGNPAAASRCVAGTSASLRVGRDLAQ